MNAHIGSYFTAPDLADIAHSLDNTERALLDKSISFESNNVDAFGNFSIEVLRYFYLLIYFCNHFILSLFLSFLFFLIIVNYWLCLYVCRFRAALDRMCGLSLIHADKSNSTETETAFVINRHDHWMTIRKLGNNWCVYIFIMSFTYKRNIYHFTYHISIHWSMFYMYTIYPPISLSLLISFSFSI